MLCSVLYSSSCALGAKKLHGEGAPWKYEGGFSIPGGAPICTEVLLRPASRIHHPKHIMKTNSLLAVLLSTRCGAFVPPLTCSRGGTQGERFPQRRRMIFEPFRTK